MWTTLVFILNTLQNEENLIAWPPRMMGRERSDNRVVNNKGKRRFALGPLRNWGEGFFFLFCKTFALLIFPPRFCFHPDFPVDSNCNSLGNLSFWKPWNLGYWLLSVADCLLGKEVLLSITVIEGQFFLYSYTDTSNLICYTERLWCVIYKISERCSLL